MNWDDAIGLEQNAPVKLADGAFGQLVRWSDTEQAVFVQVPGEDEARPVGADKLALIGGAVYELGANIAPSMPPSPIESDRDFLHLAWVHSRITPRF